MFIILWGFEPSFDVFQGSEQFLSTQWGHYKHAQITENLYYQVTFSFICKLIDFLLFIFR